jgi:hypothetical protein
MQDGDSEPFNQALQDAARAGVNLKTLKQVKIPGDIVLFRALPVADQEAKRPRKSQAAHEKAIDRWTLFRVTHDTGSGAAFRPRVIRLTLRMSAVRYGHSAIERTEEIMKTLTLALLIAFSTFTAAHAEWEILDPGMSAATKSAPVATTQPVNPTRVARGRCVADLQLSPGPIVNGRHRQPTQSEIDERMQQVIEQCADRR